MCRDGWRSILGVRGGGYRLIPMQLLGGRLTLSVVVTGLMVVEVKYVLLIVKHPTANGYRAIPIQHINIQHDIA